jgi:hypothetical protein
VWEPSQNGFLSECPHRHSANLGVAGGNSFSIQSSDDPSEPVAMILLGQLHAARYHVGTVLRDGHTHLAVRFSQ